MRALASKAMQRAVGVNVCVHSGIDVLQLVHVILQAVEVVEVGSRVQVDVPEVGVEAIERDGGTLAHDGGLKGEGR